MGKWLLAVVLFVGSFCVTTTASAHSGAARIIDATANGAGATLLVRATSADAAVANGLDIDAPAAALSQRRELVRAWLLRGIEVWADEPCTTERGDVRLVEDSVLVDVVARCGAGAMKIVDTTVAADHQTMVLIREDAGSTTTTRLNGPNDVAELSRPLGVMEAAATFMVQGAIHLVTGYDHMLFVLSLLFAAGLVSREHGTKKALRSVAWIITAFTVGHSITLVVASLGWVTLPSWLVEATIAASIIVVAAMNVFRAEATMDRAWIAFGFGLIHGFGFSSVLAELGLPATQHAVALFSFNVGIELAQLGFVAIALVPLSWLARQRFYRRVVMQAGSVAIALCASYWLVERVLGA